MARVCHPMLAYTSDNDKIYKIVRISIVTCMLHWARVILAPNEHKSEVRLGIQPVGTCQWHLSNLMPTVAVILIRISIIVH